MKNYSISKILYTVLLCFLIYSCGIEKRKYMKGFYSNHSINQNKKKVTELKEVEIEHPTNASDDNLVASISDEQLIINQKRLEIPTEIKDIKCDLLVLKNGDEISGKVTEITLTEIKYKKCENLDGPIYTIAKEDVLFIKYVNGTKEIISKIVETKKVEDDYVSPVPDKEEPIKKRKSNGFAIAGYIVALVGWAVFWFAFAGIGIPAGIVAIIFGIVGLVKCSKEPEKYKGKGMSIAAIILGVLLLITAIIFLLLIL